MKLADLADQLAHATIPSDAPPHAWARKQLRESLPAGNVVIVIVIVC